MDQRQRKHHRWAKCLTAAMSKPSRTMTLTEVLGVNGCRQQAALFASYSGHYVWKKIHAWDSWAWTKPDSSAACVGRRSTEQLYSAAIVVWLSWVAIVWSRYYEGCSINKLQNGIIVLIFKVWKIRQISVLYVLSFGTYDILTFYAHYVITVKSRVGLYIEHDQSVQYFAHW